MKKLETLMRFLGAFKLVIGLNLLAIYDPAFFQNVANYLYGGINTVLALLTGLCLFMWASNERSLKVKRESGP